MKDKNLKIFMIGWEYPPHITGGLGVACQGMARALAAQGNRVLFMTPRLHGDEPQDEGIELFDVQSRWEELTPEEREKLGRLYMELTREAGFSAYSSQDYVPPGEGTSEHEHAEKFSREFLNFGGGMLLQGGYGWSLYQEIHTYAQAAELMALRLDFDVIHAHDWMTFPAALKAAEISGKPCILHVHATEFDRTGGNLNQYVYDLERDALHRCDRIISVSGYTRDILCDKYGLPPEKIDVVYNGVDFNGQSTPKRSPEERPIKDKLVLFLGRITFQKGPDHFVQAAKLVLDKLKNVRFVMAGGGDMYHRMIEYSAELGIGDRFHYTGPLNQEDVRRMYDMADLYIMPSVSEPFGIAPLEAASRGIPVILSRQSGVSEVMNSCLKADFWDTRDLAEKIITLLTDEVLARDLQEKSLEEVKEITWERSAGGLMDSYRRLLSSHANGSN